jgi:predicted Zn-dependent peptidase
MSCNRVLLALALVGCAGGATPLPEVPPAPSSAVAHWQQPPPVAAEAELTLAMAVRRVTFDNGLSLTVVTRAGSNTTALQFLVPSAADVSEGRVAVMSDALRAGTRIDPQTVLVNPQLAYESIGISTRGVGTTFSWQVLTRATESALGLLGHFVFHPVFEPQETRERLQASLTSVQNNSGGPSHLANIARGSLPGLEVPTPEQDARGIFALTPELLDRVHRCVMSPAGAELVVVGPLAFERVEPWAKAAFGSIPVPAPAPDCGDLAVQPLAPESVKLKQIELGIVYGGAFEPIVMMSMPGPAPSSPEYVAFALLAEVLEARDAGSAQSLRHMGATYGIHVKVNGSFPGMSLLEVEGQIEETHVQAAVRQVIEDVRGLAESLTSEQLEQVKRRLRNAYVNTLSSDGGIASAALWQLRRGQSPEALARWPNELMQISLEQCRAVARHWLSDAQPSVAVAGLPGKVVRGLNLSARVRSMRWTAAPQEYKKHL